MDYNYSSSISGAGAAVWTLLMLAFYVVVIIGLWKTFVKAGHPGWAAIIPFYNLWVWIKIAGRPASWFWIMLVGALLSWIPIIGWLLLIAIWVMSLFLALDVVQELRPGDGLRRPALAVRARSCTWCSASAASSTTRSPAPGPQRQAATAAARTRLRPRRRPWAPRRARPRSRWRRLRLRLRRP